MDRAATQMTVPQHTHNLQKAELPNMVGQAIMGGFDS